MKHPLPNKPESKSLPFIVDKNALNLRSILDSKHINRAVFLDRDGTINVECGYILDPNDIELNPTAGDAIHILNDLGFLTIVITNQAAIDKKLLSLEQFERVNEKLWDELSNADAYYDALYFCPHSPDISPECFCRKPKPGLILQAAKDLDINLPTSFVVGDKTIDIEAGIKSGCKTILVLTGHGETTYKELMENPIVSPDFIAQTLGEAAEWIRYNNVKC